jgi:hypothetical protein
MLPSVGHYGLEFEGEEVLGMHAGTSRAPRGSGANSILEPILRAATPADGAIEDCEASENATTYFFDRVRLPYDRTTHE